MTVLTRLKLELSNQPYLTDAEYTQLLSENNLQPNVEYVKKEMLKPLLLTVIDVFETLTNDIDMMHSITSEYVTLSQAYAMIEVRIQQVKDKIASIPSDEDEYSMFSLLYTRKPKQSYVDWNGSTNYNITQEDIDDILGE